VHEANAPPSSAQKKVASASALVNVKDADELLLVTGPEVIVTVGGTASIVQLYVSVSLVLPARSVALTLKECAPSSKLLYACGETHAEKSASSSAHSKVDALSSLSKAKLAERLPLCDGGLELMLAFGAVASIVQS
jgi:hypothetical protein